MHTFLFDFDGTMADSFELVFKYSNFLAEKHQFKKVTMGELPALKAMSSKEVIKYLGVPYLKIPALILEMRALIKDQMHHCLAVSGIPEMIKMLSEKNVQLGILTSNSKENVEKWLQANHIRQCFSFIHTESSFFSKKHLLKKTLKRYNISASHTYYVCDETRDIEAAKYNQVSSIAVTWGYNSQEALQKYEPTALVSTVDEFQSLVAAIIERSTTA